MSMRTVRLWLPVAIIAAGLVVVAATGASETGLEGGAMLVAAGMSVWLLNWFYRLGVRGDRDRDREDRARAFFDEHGYWPDDAPAGRAADDAPAGRADRAPDDASPGRADRAADPHRRRPPDRHPSGRRPPRPRA